MSADLSLFGPVPPPRRVRRRVLLLVERLLLLVGLSAVGYVAGTVGGAALYQDYESQQLDAILRAGRPAAPADAVPPVQRHVLGRLEIPRLGVSTMIREGEDARTLQLAVGHIAGTALPGGAGNVGLAGHRDTFFRRLRDIAPGDVIRLVAIEGTFTYVVERTHVVQPDDLSVLDATAEPSLTLVTCYPFTYVGAAPERFIVRARLSAPDPPGPAAPAVQPVRWTPAASPPVRPAPARRPAKRHVTPVASPAHDTTEPLETERDRQPPRPVAWWHLSFRGH